MTAIAKTVGVVIGYPIGFMFGFGAGIIQQIVGGHTAQEILEPEIEPEEVDVPEEIVPVAAHEDVSAPMDGAPEMVQPEDVPVQGPIDAEMAATILDEIAPEVVSIEEPIVETILPEGMRVVEAEVEDVQFLEPTFVEGVRKIVKTMLTMESGQVSLSFSWIGDMPIADYDGCVDAVYTALAANQMNNQQLKRVARTVGRAFPLNDVKIDIRRMS